MGVKVDPVLLLTLFHVDFLLLILLHPPVKSKLFLFFSVGNLDVFRCWKEEKTRKRRGFGGSSQFKNQVTRDPLLREVPIYCLHLWMRLRMSCLGPHTLRLNGKYQECVWDVGGFMTKWDEYPRKSGTWGFWPPGWMCIQRDKYSRSI